MMIEALHQSGLPPEHPAYKKAVLFISRSQMLSLTNDQDFIRVGGDGGFIYTPANGGESKAGTVTVEGQPRLRSYGSMTYAGFKSLLHAQVDRDDIRVRRAFDWIHQYYTLDANPNMPGAQSQEGLFYYYHVFAKALAAWGEDTITDAAGKSHDWRQELCAALKQRQQPDGSFVNTADRWMEGNPVLVTSYSVLAIQTALHD
jgi:squalene-hopene/tetraprenyl-beta-curcumene cyclase